MGDGADWECCISTRPLPRHNYLLPSNHVVLHSAPGSTARAKFALSMLPTPAHDEDDDRRSPLTPHSLFRSYTSHSHHMHPSGHVPSLPPHLHFFPHISTHPTPQVNELQESSWLPGNDQNHGIKNPMSNLTYATPNRCSEFSTIKEFINNYVNSSG